MASAERHASKLQVFCQRSGATVQRRAPGTAARGVAMTRWSSPLTSQQVNSRTEVVRHRILYPPVLLSSPPYLVARRNWTRNKLHKILIPCTNNATQLFHVWAPLQRGMNRQKLQTILAKTPTLPFRMFGGVSTLPCRFHVSDLVFIACFTPAAALGPVSLTDTDMSPALCVEHCHGQNQIFAAIQDSSDCFCADERTGRQWL